MAVKKRSRHRTTPDYKDFVHTEPGTLNGKYMRLFWQPVYRSKDLPRAHPKPIRIMSEDFTLYRGEEGAPHVVAFRCAHRGTQLSAGWVEGDCLRCVYHGWKYDGSGQCIEQPAEEKPFAQKIRIRSCPTQEYLGLIFAYFGKGKPPALPRYSHFEVEGILDTLPILLWPCNFFQHLENAGDAAHLPFTHRDSYFSADARSGIPTAISRAETSWGRDVSRRRDADLQLWHAQHSRHPHSRAGPRNPVGRSHRLDGACRRRYLRHVSRAPFAGNGRGGGALLGASEIGARGRRSNV